MRKIALAISEGAQFLGRGQKGQDCLAWSLGKREVGIEYIDLYLESCSEQEATHIAIASESGLYNHVMKVHGKARPGEPLESWTVRSKLDKRAGVYQHRAGDALKATISSGKRFALHPSDLMRGSFPGYEGRLVAMRKREERAGGETI